MSSVPSPRLLVLGLDGACLPVLEPLCRSGRTPTLSTLFESSAVAPLESHLPPWTASAWPTLYTGTNPGKHGVFDFLVFDGYDWDVVNATHVRTRPIWELLDGHGLSSVVVNVPVTAPPREIEGAIIPGLTAPEQPPTHPPGLIEEVIEACGEYRVYPQTDATVASIPAYEATVAARAATIRYLCERFDPDFAFVQFQVTDSVFHEHEGDRHAVEQVYGAVDDAVADLLEALDPANVLTVSDHGIEPVTGWEFRVNEYLHDAGYLTRRHGGGMPTWSQDWEERLLSGENHSQTQSIGERLGARAAQAGLSTQRVARALDAVGIAGTVGRLVPNAIIRSGSDGVDFAASEAYMRSKSELGIRINLEGREPAGQVSSAAYESVRSQLIAELEAIHTPDGEPVFETVAPREAVFDGPEVQAAPDIVTVPTGFDHAIVGDLAGQRFGRPREPWNHSRYGLVGASGPAFERDVDLTGASILDIAPTICSVFDVPADEQMDGTPLPNVDRVDRRPYPPRETAPHSPTQDDSVEAHLSTLGYL